MTWSVDAPIQVGSFVISAISETIISAHFSGTGLVGVGQKRPRLFLRVQNGDVDAFDLTGRNLNAETIENLYPDAIAQLRQMLGEKGSV